MSGRSVTVLQVSDTHLQATAGVPTYGQDPDVNLRRVLDACSDAGADVDLDLCVVTGDAADDASSVAYERLADELGAVGAPLLALPGNHDDPRRLADVIGPMRPIELGGWRLVPVDTSRPGDVHGTVDAVALADELDRHDERPTVLALHHPPRSPSGEPAFGLVGADELLAIVARRPYVRLVISGHVHEPFEIALGTPGATLLGAPSTCVGIRHDETGHHTGDPSVPIGARLIELHGDATWRTTLITPGDG